MGDTPRITAARHALGRQLADLRAGVGLTQHRLATVLAYSRTTLANVEVGRQHTGRDFWDRADTALDAAGTLLAGYDALQELILDHRQAETASGRRRRPAASQDQDGDVERRDFLRAVSMAGAALAAPAASTPASGRVPNATLDSYAELNAHLWRVFGLASTKQATMPLVRDQLATLTRHLSEPQTGASRRRLSVLTGDLFQLAGEIHFDGSRYADAAQAYTLAATASRDAEDFDLWAAAMVRHSYLSLYEQQPAQAAPMLELAGRLAARGDSQLTTRHWVAAVHAEALAGLGDRAGCERALALAGQAGGHCTPGGWLRFDAGRVAEDRGACYLALGQPELAEEALRSALQPGVSARRRGAVLADLAAAGVQRGDVDQVVHYGRQAAAVAAETRSGWVAAKLGTLRTQLAPMLDDGRVRALHDQIS